MKFNKEVFNTVIDNIPLPLSILAENKAKAVITGSFIFCTYGLMSDFGDVDIVIYDLDKDLTKHIYDYWETYGLQRYETNTSAYLGMKIEKGGFTYNILSVADYTYNPILFTDDSELIGLDTIDNALSIKMELNRNKDRNHLDDMIKMFERFKK